jgi:hypothetical protein
MDFRDIELFNRKLRVYPNGDIFVKRCNRDEFYEKKYSIRSGYRNLILTHEMTRKTYKVHRIIAYTYLGLDINNPKILIDHIDRNTQNNRVSNLRLVTHQQNCFNTIAKGYYWNKRSQKWLAQIKLDGKLIRLGLFEKEDDARQAYLNAKEKYHLFIV